MIRKPYVSTQVQGGLLGLLVAFDGAEWCVVWPFSPTSVIRRPDVAPATAAQTGVSALPVGLMGFSWWGINLGVVQLGERLPVVFRIRCVPLGGGRRLGRVRARSRG
jgi:hypothetical protein